jgi:hypothetical protein
MTEPLADAVADLRLAFGGFEIVVDELEDGSIWVTLVGVGIGKGWNRDNIDLAVKLQTTYPDTEPYPFYTDEGLVRIDGSSYAPVQPSVSVEGEIRTQISLRKNGSMRPGEDLGARFWAVVRYLRNPT